ncbi:MAG: tRNA (guanosine(46)-N7)-methyltransferase TrmB [Planctomycetota bacterium]|nr:MAG: tRNA (guanosine(46)-N7)-methyltransferase TrmB [Planctomycetota bacterium]
MSFGLGHGRTLDPAVGLVGICPSELPPLPDDILTNPQSGRVDPRRWFEHPDRPFEIEIGSGKGTFLIQQAALQPEVNFLGIEWAHEFYAYAADRVRRRRQAGQLQNVRMLHGDATEFLHWRCPDAICRVVHLYFSDPWPKNRHHKKRVIQHRFLADVWRVLVPGGELRVVTDHAGLWAWDMAHFEQWAGAGDNIGPGPQAAKPGSLPNPSSQSGTLARLIDQASLNRARGSIPTMPEPVQAQRKSMPDVPFELLAFDRPASAGADEIVGTNFERKFREEGRDFFACTLRKRV